MLTETSSEAQAVAGTPRRDFSNEKHSRTFPASRCLSTLRQPLHLFPLVPHQVGNLDHHAGEAFVAAQ